MSAQYSEKVMQHFTNPHNVGEIPNADGVGQVGNPVCLVSGTIVQLNNHYREIEVVQDNERVLTHEGTYSTIRQRSTREYSGPVIMLENDLGTVEMTPEHMVLAIKRSEQNEHDHDGNEAMSRPEWYHVNELEPGDISLYPILKETWDRDHFALCSENGVSDHRGVDHPENVPLDADMLLLSGHYLAGGNAITTATSPYLCFTFDADAVEQQNEVVRIIKDKFGLEASVRPGEDNQAALVIVNNANLSRAFVDVFGKGADKHIPDIMMFLPPQKQAHLLRGLWRGGGQIENGRTGLWAGYPTASIQLAGQVKTLLLRQNIIPLMNGDAGPVMENARHQTYRIYVNDAASLRKLCEILGADRVVSDTEKECSWIKDSYLFMPIKSIRSRQFTGTVHNFEVADQHSYATDSFAVHNCGDMMYIYITVKDNILTDVKFKTFGCGAAIATSSMVTDLAKGKTLEEGLKITRKDVAENLGGLPPQKMHCSNLAADALHEAIHDYLRKQGREPPLPPGAKKPHEDEACEVDEALPIQIGDSPPKQ